MNETLRKFYQDAITRQEVLEFVLDQLNKDALELVYKGEDTTHIAQSRSTLLAAFGELKGLYEKKERKEVLNPAR